LLPRHRQTLESTFISDQVLSKGYPLLYALLAPVQTCARRTIKVLDLNTSQAFKTPHTVLASITSTITNTKTYAAAAMKSALIKDQRATGRTKGVGATEPPLKTPLMQSSIQEPTGQPMGIAAIKPGMLTRDKLCAVLCKVLGIQKPTPVQTEAPIQVKAICIAYKHSRMPARQTEFKPVQGNKKPTIGTSDNHHVTPPKNQLMKSQECFHCHKSGHYAHHCRTKRRADQDRPGTTIIKATSAQVTKPGLTTAN